MRTLPLLVAALLSLGLTATGCSSFRAPPDPAEERAERLRQPPQIPNRVAEATPTEQGEPAPARASLGETADGQPALLVEESFFQAWRMVGLSLDRAGFTVEDRDRSRGEYYIRYDVRADVGARRKGFWGTLAFWRGDEPDSLRPYVVKLVQEGRQTRVLVTDEDGEPAEREAAERILELVGEQLR